MKVAMIADFPARRDRINGGVEAVTSYLVHALKDVSDVQLHVISFERRLEHVTVLEEDAYVHHLIPYAPLGTLTGFAQDQKALNACLAAIRPDVVHSQGAGHHGILTMRASYPAVVTIHGILTKEARFQRGLQRQMRTRVQAWLSHYHYVRRATHTILISPYVAEHYGATLTGRKYLIPNPVHPHFFDLVRQEKPGRILFAGRLYSLKGVKDLLRAVAKVAACQDVRLVLAGSMADKDYISELNAELASLGLMEIVDFRGILPMAALLEEFAQCSCLVLPSYQETAPLVIQEAMASGVPVIASDICGIPYQVVDGQTGLLFRPGNIESLAANLSTLLSNRTMREEFGAAAKVRAEREYRATAVARRTLEVYQDVLEDAYATGL